MDKWLRFFFTMFSTSATISITCSHDVDPIPKVCIHNCTRSLVEVQKLLKIITPWTTTLDCLWRRYSWNPWPSNSSLINLDYMLRLCWFLTYIGGFALQIFITFIRGLCIHSKLRSITPMASKVHVILHSFVVLIWMRDALELVYHVTLWNHTKEVWGQFEFVLLSPTLVWSHSTWPSQAMWWTHAPTFNKWHQKKKRKNESKKVTLHMLTNCAMWGCGLTSWVVCIDDKFCDIRERNVTIRSGIWTMNIRSLGFRDIRECVTLWRLILRSLGCMFTWAHESTMDCASNIRGNFSLEVLGLSSVAKSTCFHS
jgi:hypothetical protein